MTRVLLLLAALIASAMSAAVLYKGVNVGPYGNQYAGWEMIKQYGAGVQGLANYPGYLVDEDQIIGDTITPPFGIGQQYPGYLYGAGIQGSIPGGVYPVVPGQGYGGPSSLYGQGYGYGLGSQSYYYIDEFGNYVPITPGQASFMSLVPGIQGKIQTVGPQSSLYYGNDYGYVQPVMGIQGQLPTLGSPINLYYLTSKGIYQPVTQKYFMHIMQGKIIGATPQGSNFYYLDTDGHYQPLTQGQKDFLYTLGQQGIWMSPQIRLYYVDSYGKFQLLSQSDLIYVISMQGYQQGVGSQISVYYLDTNGNFHPITEDQKYLLYVLFLQGITPQSSLYYGSGSLSPIVQGQAGFPSAWGVQNTYMKGYPTIPASPLGYKTSQILNKLYPSQYVV